LPSVATSGSIRRAAVLAQSYLTVHRFRELDAARFRILYDFDLISGNFAFLFNNRLDVVWSKKLKRVEIA
jgi:hypothetical protein